MRVIRYEMDRLQRTHAGLQRLATDYRQADDEYGDVRAALGSPDAARASTTSRTTGASGAPSSSR